MQSITQGLSETYEAKPSSVAVARTAVAEFAAAAGASDAQVSDVRLATSEAVTNVVLHAYQGRPGQIGVTAALAGHELWILIADEGSGMRPRAARPGLGLGLGLISQVCDDMAIVPRSCGGTEVRLLFNLAVGSGQIPQSRRPQGQQSQNAAVIGTPAELSVDGGGPVPAVPAASLAD